MELIYVDVQERSFPIIRSCPFVPSPYKASCVFLDLVRLLFSTLYLSGENMRVMQIHPHDDVLVALEDFQKGDIVEYKGQNYTLVDNIPAKHKFAVRDLDRGKRLKMYGFVVGEVQQSIRVGQLITPANLTHATEDLQGISQAKAWSPPDVSRWSDSTFAGYARDDGKVGTRNYWLVVPLVFCENRNLRVMRDSMVEELGYKSDSSYRHYTRSLIKMAAAGKTSAEIRETTFEESNAGQNVKQQFPNIDGLKFLAHDGGCGGSYGDALNLCGLLAGYINHPNVAGATVLSLGCQKSQIADLENQIHARNANFSKPLLIFEQQQIGTEQALMSKAIRHTFAGLIDANHAQREPAALSHLTVGMECGGSDGFSGISANPAIGYCSDLIVALGGAVILAEFPELAGCENELASRCTERATAQRFLDLMEGYEKQLSIDGIHFDENPSPGNIRDGLVTDAMKSAGAARKGGTSPITDVLDYPEQLTRQGLNLLCTPGGDVESTTAMAGSGATAMLFSTGLGTPTGNPISPVLKVSSNSTMARKMPDIIDCDAGGIITGEETIEQVGGRLLDHLIDTASNLRRSKAELLGQDDFIPWKRNLTF